MLEFMNYLKKTILFFKSGLQNKIATKVWRSRFHVSLIQKSRLTEICVNQEIYSRFVGVFWSFVRCIHYIISVVYVVFLVYYIPTQR